MPASSALNKVPRYRSPALSSRLPPPKLPVFRSVVQHPPAPFAVEAANRAAEAQQEGSKTDKKGKGKASSPASPRPLIGPTQLLYSTSPRPLIPLTASPFNHKLWNPPAPDSEQTRSVEKDESGRLARFAGRFGGAASGESAAEDAATKGKKKDEPAALFGIEGDLSWLEGVTAQSPGGALGKRDIVGAPKAAKGKGKK
ncbi:hypothetical protein JCM11251_006149 [Rhodosporidiobolus azoricus]